MTPRDAVDRPLVTATVALMIRLLLGSAVAYMYANAGLYVPVAAMSDPAIAALPCTTIKSWSDLASAFDAVAAERNAQYENAEDEAYDEVGHPPSRPPQPPVVLLCPFDIIHDGTNYDGYDITTPDLTVVCWKNALGSGGDDACTITGTARHFNIATNNVNLSGIRFRGSRNGAVVVNGGVEGATFVGSEFLE